MAANPDSYDLISDLLSTNNTINIATLVVTIVLGAITIGNYYLTWRHQRWEYQLEDERGRRRAIGKGLHGRARIFAWLPTEH